MDSSKQHHASFEDLLNAQKIIKPKIKAKLLARTSNQLESLTWTPVRAISWALNTIGSSLVSTWGSGVR